MSAPVTLLEGTSPIVLAQPHSGTWLPPAIAAKLTPAGAQLLDTDWHIPQLYEGLLPDATVVRAEFSRYAIDANRPPDGASLYPGQNTTGLVPLTTFDGLPLWTSAPQDTDIEQRLAAFHRPYHDALRCQLDRVRDAHGFALLYDCHSIRSHIPHLFEGRLPDLNIGTNSGLSCSPAIERAVADACGASTEFTSVLNGRFKGGWTTRHYGEPARNIHAVQMEIAQSAYLASEAPPFSLSPDKSAQLRALLSRVFDAIQETFGDLT